MGRLANAEGALVASHVRGLHPVGEEDHRLLKGTVHHAVVATGAAIERQSAAYAGARVRSCSLHTAGPFIQVLILRTIVWHTAAISSSPMAMISAAS